MNKELSPQAKEMIANYIRTGARLMSALIAELTELKIEGLPQNRELTEYLMEKFNAKFTKE